MSTSCCIDGRPPKDQAFENLVVQKRVTACETNTRSLCATTANIVDGDADTLNVTNLTVTNLTVNNIFNSNLPQNIFFNGTTVTNPALYSLGWHWISFSRYFFIACLWSSIGKFWDFSSHC